MSSNNKFFITSFIIFTITLAIGFTIVSFYYEIHRPKLPMLGEIKPFELTDSNNMKFDSKELRGKVWIADFFFTSCSDICPMLTKHMASLNRSFELVPDIFLVSISVNPENDTPAVLKQYAQKQNAKKNWIFLTGSRAAITDVAVNSFKLGDIKEPIFHSAHFTLVDKLGFIRGYYDGTNQEEVNQLFKDAAKLLKERMHGFN